MGDNYKTGVSRNFLYLWNNAGGKIENIINGNIVVGASRALSISNCHFERGNIEIKSCPSITIKDSSFNYLDGLNKIVINRINSSSRSYSNISLENLLFNIEDESIFHSNVYDVVCDLSNISIKNCNRRHSTNLMGLKLGLISDSNVISDFSEYNIKSSIYSDNCFIANKNITESFMYHLKSGTMNVSLSLNDSVSFEKESGTYYYKSIVFTDDIRIIGQGNRTEQTITTDGKAINITGFYNNGIQNSNMRLFRGTSSNNYKEYVDIPIKYGTQLIDFGTHVSGFYWKSIVNENPSNINFGNNGIYFKNKCITYLTAIPQYGSWTKGDIIINNNPSSGAIFGWICIESGTPGTWKKISTIDN